MKDFRQSAQHVNYLKETGWLVEKLGGSFVFIRRLPLIPVSVLKIQRPEKLPDFSKIDQLARKHRAISVTIEPTNRNQVPMKSRIPPALPRVLGTTGIGEVGRLKIRNYGYKLSKSPYLPTKTIQLDLAQSQESLLAQMKKDARYSLRKIGCRSNCFEAKNEKEIERFYRAWRRAVGWRKLIPSLKNIKILKKSFGQNAFFLAFKKEEIVAGTIILIAQETAYYYYAFTNPEGRKLLAQSGLVWEAIKKAKKKGCLIFDFEGIFDSRFPVKSWRGFSHFKKSFGGKEVDYPGCFKKNWLSSRRRR